MYTTFKSKWTTLNFLAQICPKMYLGLQIGKSDVRKNQQLRDTLCGNFQPKWTTLTFSAQILPKNGFRF